MTTLPYPYIDGAEGEPRPGFVRNEPSPEGAELAAELARFADAEYVKTGRDTRCETCAFRLGTVPNQCLATVANALKSAVEKDPFLCHESDRPCGGWAGLVRGTI